MDGFGDDFVPQSNDVDPAAEFLKREQDELGGLVDDISSAPPATTNADPFGDSLDPLANVPPSVDDSGVVPGFSSSDDFVVLNKEETAEAPPAAPAPVASSPVPPSHSPVTVKREEPEKIKRWREEQKERLEKKDDAEQQKKEELRLQAKKDLEEWYKHHDEQISKTRAANRSAEKQYVYEESSPEPGQDWERIAKLCDFNPKASRGNKDVSRMRGIILQLKQSPPQRT